MRLALLIALLALPLAAADLDASTAFAGGELPHDGPTTIPVTVEVGCDLVLASGGGSGTVTLMDAPPWLSAPASNYTVEVGQCAGDPQGAVAQVVELVATPAGAAPGLVHVALNVSVTFVPELDDPTATLIVPRQATVGVPPIHVAYRPGHTIEPSGDRTFTVPADKPYSFDMRIAIQANARTMVMFEDKLVSDPDALLQGLKAATYDVAKGQLEEVRKVTFTPPSGDWDEVTVTFRTFSHCLDGTDCPELLEQTHTWTFVNEAPGAPGNQQEADAKEAPGAPLALVVLALAVVAWRRR